MNISSSLYTANMLASQISANQNNLLAEINALSSGSSLGTASPADVALSSSYSVQLSSQAQAMNNIQDGSSMLSTASSGLSQITSSLQQIRDLTVQAGDGALNASDLQDIQTQISQLSQGIDQISGNTQFAGQNLLDGSQSNLTLQVGANTTDSTSVSIGNFSSTSLGLSALNVNTPAGQASALSSIDSALQQVSTQNSTLGAAQNTLTASLSNLSTNTNNLSAANSALSDTNYAQVSSDFAQSMTQQQATTQVLSMYNAMQANGL